MPPKKNRETRNQKDQNASNPVELCYIYPIPPIYILGRGFCIEECDPQKEKHHKDRKHHRKQETCEETSQEHHIEEDTHDQYHQENQATEHESACDKKNDENDPNRYNNFYNNYNIDWHSAGASQEDEVESDRNC